MTPGKMEFETVLELACDSVSEDGHSQPKPKTIILEMGELPGADDHLLMGFPNIAKFTRASTKTLIAMFGFTYFQKLKVLLLAESPPKEGS